MVLNALNASRKSRAAKRTEHPSTRSVPGMRSTRSTAEVEVNRMLSSTGASTRSIGQPPRRPSACRAPS